MVEVWTEARIKKLVTDELETKKKMESHFDATDDRLLKSTKRLGLAERELKKYKLEIMAIAQPVQNWALSTKDVILGLAGTKTLTKDNANILPRMAVGFLKLFKVNKRRMEQMKLEGELFEARKDSMSTTVRLWQKARLVGMSVGTAIMTMVTILITMGVVLGLASLAIQGTDSQLYQFFETLDRGDKIKAVLGALATVFYALGLGFGSVAIAALGFITVLKGDLGPYMSVIVTVLSSILLAVGLIFLAVPSGIALMVAALVGALVLIYRFRDTIWSTFKSLGTSIWDATIGRFLNGLRWLIRAWRRFKNWRKEGGTFTGELAGMAYKASTGGYQDNSSVTINVNGRGGQSDAGLAKEITRSLSIEKRRRGGGMTQGAVP